MNRHPIRLAKRFYQSAAEVLKEAPAKEALAINKPRFWNGVPPIDPAAVTINAANMTEAEIKNNMQDAYREYGLAHVKNTGFTEFKGMNNLIQNIVTDVIEYEAGANPRGMVEPNVYDVGAPLTADLHYHHEMAYVGYTPYNIGFGCLHACRPGHGQTFVSDNIKATDHILQTELGQKLVEKGLCYHRNLTDRNAFKDAPPIGVYNHWQQSMGTEDPDEAALMAQEKGLETSWGPNGLLMTRFYVSAFEYFPQMDRNLLYSSIADHSMWFDSWPFVMQLPQDQRPLDLTFADHTPLTQEELVQFSDLYDNYGMPIEWEVGDVAVICNMRWLHGRPSIHLQEGEKRELGVVLGSTYERIGPVEGKF